MNSSGQVRFKILRGWGSAAHRVPALSILAVRHMVVPSGYRYSKIAWSEGARDAHWKTIGDGMARFFQEAGPVLTKLGQILATRTDLLPEATCKRLEILYDRQPAVSQGELSGLINKSFGKRWPFKKFEWEPIAVGSVGQVHRAVLKDGSRVIVKLIRPGSERKIKRDIYTLMAISRAVFGGLGRDFRSTKLMVMKTLEDLELAFISELDLAAEGRALEHFRKKMKSNSRVYIPRLYKEYSSSQMLVVEEVKGESLAKFREKNISNKKASKSYAELALREILMQIFNDGNFHADPHAGNFLVMEDGRLALIDFGLTGEFTSKDRKKIGRAVKAFLARDTNAVIKNLLEFGTLPAKFDLEKFKKDIKAVLEKNHGAQLDRLVTNLFKVAYQHQICIPQSTTLLIKTLVTVEGVARSLDAELSLVAVATPVILRSITPRWLRFWN